MSLNSRNFLSISARRRYLYAVMAVLTLLAVSATSVTEAADHSDAAQASRHGAMDDDHLKRVIQFVMDRIGEPQNEQVGRLAHAAFDDLEVFERKAEAVRAPRGQILLADVIDRSALERARVAELHIADERSRRVDQLLIEVAGLLTQQQRALLRTEMAN